MNLFLYVGMASCVFAVLSDNILPPTKIQKRETKHELHIYVITLTHFHLYWKIIILQDIYTNTMEKVTKIHFPTKRRRETRREAHLPCESGPSTDVDVTLAQEQTAMRKMVVGRPHLGVAAPRVCPHPEGHQLSPPSMWHLLVAPS